MNPRRLLVALVVSAYSLTANAQTIDVERSEWTTECFGSSIICELSTTIESNNTVAARVSIFYNRGQYYFQYQIPVGIDLQEGISISIDESPMIETEIKNCTHIGCSGSIRVVHELIQALKDGENLFVHFTSPDSLDRFSIAFSLGGFTRGFEYLVAGQNSP